MAIGSTVPSTAPAAARAWAAGGSWPEALTVLAGSWDDVLADPDLSWLDSAPPDVLDHPLVRTARAECARRDGRLQTIRTIGGSQRVLVESLFTMGFRPQPFPTSAMAAAFAVRAARGLQAFFLFPEGSLAPHSTAAPIR